MIVRRLVERLRPAPSHPDLDVEFYGSYHADLRSFPEETLRRHYAANGKREGRPANAEQMSNMLIEKFGPLPAGFEPLDYIDANPDLKRAFTTPWQGLEHYLRLGRKENRELRAFHADLYRSLYFPDVVISDFELKQHYQQKGREQGLTGSWRTYLEAGPLKAGPWLDRLDVEAFELLNWRWAGPTPDKRSAVDKLIESGLERLAPIAFEAVFEPDYYREAHAELAGLSDREAYVHWLTTGLQKAWPGSTAEHLTREGQPPGPYPKDFLWRDYASGLSGRPTRWEVLEHWLRHGFVETRVIPFRPGTGGATLLALGLHWRGRNDPVALDAMLAARGAGAEGHILHHETGDAHYRLGEPHRALTAFRAAASFPEAGLWTFVNGARAAAQAGAFKAAFDLLRAGRDRYAGEVAWRDAVEHCIEAFFHRRTGRARRLYAFPEGRARADAQVARIIDRVAALWAELDPVGASTPADADGRVVMLANLDLRVCTHYRVEQKQQLFDTLGRPFVVYGLHQWKEFLSALPGATAAIFFRLPAWPSVVRCMQAATAMDVPTYYEIDDLIFDAAEYPDTLASYGGLLGTSEYEGLLYGVPINRAAALMCDYGLVSTTPLARAVRPLVKTGEVFLLPNGLDDRNEGWLTDPLTRVRRGDEVVITYASGTKAHNSDFNDLVGSALVSLLSRRPNVRFLLVGHLALDPAFDAVRGQITRFEYVPSSESFWSMLADCDINLAVLIPTWATDCKSEIKWLEAAVLGVPSIVSETAMYREVLEDGVDALIARNPQEWAGALDRMVDDPGLRKRIGEAARTKAAERYAVVVNAKRMDAALQPAIARRRPLTVRPGQKPRILLSNVWFPPQSIGGATRVVRNNLDDWLDAGMGETHDFAVFCTDNDASPPYRLRLDSYRNVPVHRLSTPIQPNMDWRPEDPAVGEAFRRVLDTWKPDLVHFHAVQRLTASVVEVCRDAGVPYLVTTHDAWWLSDHHFLVDEAGRLHEPCEDLPRHPPLGVSVAASLDRRRLLSELLGGAEAALGVSDSFTSLYRDCSVANARSVPNGLPPLHPAPRRPSENGRVRLAHVGNTSKHKGFHLVRAALEQGGFQHLELTVVDHALPPGGSRETRFGSTPVRYVGKTAQDRMGEFYAGVDVLLAPSIWPESFGLVTREALACGCWVVASDRGAIGDAVESGRNGFVVDVGTVEGLLTALAAIDGAPETYLRSPEHRPELRTSAEQSRELAMLYAEVLGRTGVGVARTVALKPSPVKANRRAASRFGPGGGII